MTLNNIKVGSRLGLAFGLILFIMAVISVTGIWRLQGLADTTQRLGTIDNEKLKMAVQWRQTIDLNWIRTRASIMDADTSRIPMWQADMDKTSEISTASRKRLIELVQAEEGKKLIAEIDARREAYRTPRSAVLKRRQAGEDVTAVLERELRPLADAYSESIHKLEEFQQKLYDASLARAEENAAQGRWILIVGSVLALLLGAASALVLTRSITGPLRQAARSARFIADGDLTQPIHSVGKDEAAELLQALKTMQDNLLGIVGNVRSGTDTIATASSQIAAGNHDLSSRTEEQASSLEETAASMEELTSTVKQNADNAMPGESIGCVQPPVWPSRAAVWSPKWSSTMGDIKRVLGQEDRRDHLGHRRHRLPDQYPGAERGGRSGACRRTGPRLCGRGRRSAQPGPAQCGGGQGNQGADRRLGRRRSKPAARWSTEAGKTMGQIVDSVKRVTRHHGRDHGGEPGTDLRHRADQPGHHADGPGHAAECGAGRGSRCGSLVAARAGQWPVASGQCVQGQWRPPASRTTATRQRSQAGKPQTAAASPAGDLRAAQAGRCRR
jgi:methyl-accepting chemotaxis protein